MRRVTITQDELLAAQLGTTKMIGAVEKDAFITYVKAAAGAVRDAGGEPGEDLVRALLDARRTEKCERFAAEMAAMTGTSNIFARLEFGNGKQVGIGLIFGEGKLMDAVSGAFDTDIAEADDDVCPDCEEIGNSCTCDDIGDDEDEDL